MNNLSTPEKQAFNQERREVLQQLEDWMETPMLVLGLAWLVLFVIELTWGLSPLLEVLGTVIWIIFILDFTLKFTLAPSKFVYLKSNWVTAIALISRRQKAEGRRQKVKDTSCLVSGGRHFTFNYVHLLIASVTYFPIHSCLTGVKYGTS